MSTADMLNWLTENGWNPDIEVGPFSGWTLTIGFDGGPLRYYHGDYDRTVEDAYWFATGGHVT